MRCEQNGRARRVSAQARVTRRPLGNPDRRILHSARADGIGLYTDSLRTLRDPQRGVYRTLRPCTHPTWAA
eukprot:1361222-Pyramimonas_sp.AAC.1